jgi:hypothetical protein
MVRTLRGALRAGALVAVLARLCGCGSSAPPQCPPCPAPAECDPRIGVCVGFRTPLLDAAVPDATLDGADYN